MPSANISNRHWYSEQSWYQEVVFKDINGVPLKAYVRHNAYEFQSYAELHRWDGTRWQLVHRIAGEELPSHKRKLTYGGGWERLEASFAEVIGELIMVYTKMVTP